MNRTLVALVAALAVVGCKKNEPVTAAPIAPPAGGFPAVPPPGGVPGAMPPSAMPPPAMPPGGMPGGMPQGGMVGASAGASQFDPQIAATQQLLAQNPKNVQAWTTLGNLYFDSFKATNDRQRAQASVDAYQKALDLDPKNPDVLTDQGVMYRDLGNPDKALANFLQANKLNPNHMQSLMNAGVVYMDKGDTKKAEETWVKVVATDKTGQFAGQAGAALAELRQRRGGSLGAPGAPGMPPGAPGMPPPPPAR